MLPHARLTISRCTQWQSWTSTVFTTRQHMLIFTAFCYTYRQLPAFSTYVHGEAQTPLAWFTTKFTTNPQFVPLEFEPQCIAWLACTAIGATNKGLPHRTHCRTQLSIVNQPWHNFSKSRIVHATMGHMSPTLPSCHPYARTCDNECLCQIWSSYFHPLRQHERQCEIY